MISGKKAFLFLVVNIFVVFSFAANSHSASEEEMYQQARKSYYDLKKSAEKRKFRHNWIKSIDKYKKVASRFPKGKRTDESLYMAAKIYTELYPYSSIKDDLVKSNSLLENLVDEHSGSGLADDACFMMGENYEKMGRKSMAYGAYMRVLEEYKKGDLLKDARSKVKRLKRYSASKSAAKKSPDISSRKNNTTAVRERKLTKGNMARVTGVRHWSNPNYTRIVIDMDNMAKYKSHLLRKDPGLGKPPRLYIDIFGTRKAGSLKEEIPINDGLLKRARAAQYDHNTVRVVLDIESVKDYKIYPMPGPFRIVIDVFGDDVIKAPSIEALLQGEKEKKGVRASVEEESLTLSRQLGLAVRKIVLDPGHGGKDPGAVGPKGTKEKDVNLKVAKMLKKRLERQYNYKVILTRSDDRYLDLVARTAIANMENADLFVSIHANASKNRKAYGMETYVMNARASDRYAAEVAARENAVTSNSMGEFGSILEEILVDMQKTNKVNESSKLAGSVQGNMHKGMAKKYSRIKNLGVKKAPFYVLIGANMPSILVETGFISNYKEEKRLRSSKYLENLSIAMAKGINGYAKISKRGPNI
ncbi:MAG: N-acetylmuramoyl-L-alanine amidase [Proteobacteria bacterium]|nr:N-acetylmuramoyl-L-alanine amidase [Pseudomonadota bacterium]